MAESTVTIVTLAQPWVNILREGARGDRTQGRSGSSGRVAAPEQGPDMNMFKTCRGREEEKKKKINKQNK